MARITSTHAESRRSRRSRPSRVASRDAGYADTLDGGASLAMIDYHAVRSYGRTRGRLARQHDLIDFNPVRVNVTGSARNSYCNRLEEKSKARAPKLW